MKPSQQCYDLIKSFEGLSLRAYKPVPTEKYYTIGYGHHSADVVKNQRISVEQAEQLLLEDVCRICTRIRKYLVGLEQNQYDAIVSFTYNVGVYNLCYSTTGLYLLDLNISYKPICVARRIVLWTRAGGKVLLGLQKRRVAEANLFMGEERFSLVDGVIRELS